MRGPENTIEHATTTIEHTRTSRQHTRSIFKHTKNVTKNAKKTKDTKNTKKLKTHYNTLYQRTLESIMVTTPLYNVKRATSPPVALSAHQNIGSRKVTRSADALVRAEHMELVASGNIKCRIS